MNHIRENSKNTLSPDARVFDGATLIPPVRLYGTVVIDEKSTIGKYTYIGTGTYVVNCKVGNYCSIARGIEIGAKAHPLTMLSSHPFQYNNHRFTSQPGYKISKVKPPPKDNPMTEIGSDVWIGTKSVIRGGVKVGHGAVIGASSVVTKDVRPYAIVAGSPAKEIRLRFDETTITRLLNSKWWQLDPADMDGIDFNDIEAALNEIESRRDIYKKQVIFQLSGTLTNTSSSRNGIIWFDVEKSYAEPEILLKATEINIIRSPFGTGTFKIEKSWHNEKNNRYGIRIHELKEEVPKGTVIFNFSKEMLQATE